MHRHKRQRKGFTLIELLVAVTLLGLMLFLVNELFQTTSVAVTTSVQQSKAIASTRSLGEQIRDDTAKMVGPARQGSGGYIVIIQRRIPQVTMLDPNNLAEFKTEYIRSDQIVFIRDAVGMRSMTPQDGASYQSNLIGQPGDVAKVYYGHGQRLENDGTIPGTGANYRLGGDNAGFDRVGSDWILCRQALLFNPTDAIALAAGQPNPTVAGAPNRYTHAANASAYSQVRNTGFSGNKLAYMGLTDVTAQRYYAPSDPGALVSQFTNPNSLTNIAALNGAYLNTSYYQPNLPLRVNPSPTQTGYEPWAIAQSHPILAPNCSDFVVQFAADLNGNGRVDTDGPSQRPSQADRRGNTLWYDCFDPNAARVNWSGTTWQNLLDSRFQPFVNIDQNTKAFIFKVDDGLPFTQIQNRSLTSAWPYMIRIRYRLHGNRGRLRSNDPGALTDGIDNNGDGNVDEVGEDQIAGRWFEHIIKVPRP